MRPSTVHADDVKIGCCAAVAFTTSAMAAQIFPTCQRCPNKCVFQKSFTLYLCIPQNPPSTIDEPDKHWVPWLYPNETATRRHPVCVNKKPPGNVELAGVRPGIAAVGCGRQAVDVYPGVDRCLAVRVEGEGG